ncbi:MFS transporter [Streptomyces sp. NPDC059009]|uniref:MFS transporter n=1 Tax=Streptomyces sp. NPDC059009 TaxID=3346694 RepID=UPI003675F309
MLRTPTLAPAAASPNGRTRKGGWAAVGSVTLGIFVIVTAEILPIGLLTSIGGDFTVSDGTAGLMMTLPGLLAAACAPLLTAATARVDRRRMLCGFMVLLALGDLLAAAPGFWLVLVSRVVVGVVIGGFWSIAAGLAERFVPERSVGRATAVIFSAVPLGSVLGVPAGTLVGDLAGWRTAFVVLGVLTVAVLGLMLAVVPPLPPRSVTRLRVLRGLVRGARTRYALALTFLLVLAHFGTYTYVTPFLERVTGVGPGRITVFLLVYGVAGVLGNFAGGAAVARWPRGTAAAAASGIAAVTLALPVAGHAQAGAVALLVLWGIAYGAVPVVSQRCFAAAAPRSPEAASVLFTAAFQATFSLGALAGGAVLDRTSEAALMTYGGGVALLALATVAVQARAAARKAKAATMTATRT